MQYVPAPGPQMTLRTVTNSNIMPGNVSGLYQAPAMQCMMYGQAVYGPPMMYSPINSQVTYPVRQKCMTHGVQYINNLNSLDLASSNFVETGKPDSHLKTEQTHTANVSRDRKRAESQALASKADQGSIISHSSTNASYQSSKSIQWGNSEEKMDKTDRESSYSSFCSSFFKTESGRSAESSDSKKDFGKIGKKSAIDGGHGNWPAFETEQIKNSPRRKMVPPWMEHVCVTSELIYKYQILTKSMDEVLSGDKQKIKTLEQPSLVNEQLSQLYLDLQLEGVAARLTLEEGITSSSSSGEESIARASKGHRKKRQYSKLVMIYEENAPLPPPDSPSGTSNS
ncbi:unnamed protein product [Parnassius apollo]|uniref:Period circadian protein n=1 Tax=Parnassius apollo TaxID=110799 RepID=A0A8S3VY32_PARAO|nr:unnamed protein product [Parnassius apollo]